MVFVPGAGIWAAATCGRGRDALPDAGDAPPSRSRPRRDSCGSRELRLPSTAPCPSTRQALDARLTRMAENAFALTADGIELNEFGKLDREDLGTGATCSGSNFGLFPAENTSEKTGRRRRVERRLKCQ